MYGCMYVCALAQAGKDVNSKWYSDVYQVVYIVYT